MHILNQESKKEFVLHFWEEGVPQEMVDQYFRNCGDGKVFKTKDRRLLANSKSGTCQIVQYYAELLDEDAVVQSRAPVCKSGKRYMVKFEGPVRMPGAQIVSCILPHEKYSRAGLGTDS